MMTLDGSQIDAFHADGFLHLPGVFTPAEMDEIDAAFERLHAVAERVAAGRGDETIVLERGAKFTYNDAGHVRHVAMCGNVEPVLLRFGRDPRLLRIAGDLLGSDAMDQLINQAHFKRPGSAVAFDWHQDSQHRGADRGGFDDLNGRGSYVQIALAVDPSTPDNGPLQFVRGSQRHGHLGAAVADHVEPADIVTPMLRRGDVAAFGPYTIHGSEANRSDRSRRVFINGFAYPGANHRDYGLPHAGERLTPG